MKNPFEYGGVVSGGAFCNREKELADLVRAMENAEKLFVFSERRYGKTSLVRAALAKLPKKGLRLRLRGFVADGQRGDVCHRRGQGDGGVHEQFGG